MSRNFLKGNHEGSLTKKSIKISAGGGGGGVQTPHSGLAPGDITSCRFDQDNVVLSSLDYMNWNCTHGNIQICIHGN